MTVSPIASVRVLHIDRRRNFDWDYLDLCAPYWRFYWNFRGAASVSLGRRAFDLLPNTAYLVPPDTQFASHGHDIDHFYIHFALPDDVVLIRHDVFEVPASARLQPAVEMIASQAVADADTVSHLPAQPADSTGGSHAAAGRSAVAAAGLVLIALALLPEDVPLATVSDPIVRSAIRYMSDRPELRLTAHDIAVACGCDERSLRRRFLRELGMTPVRFFSERRIEHSCVLLHFSQLSIDEIARDTGFCDRHHFTKAFKNARGVTPVAFRRISDELSAG